MRQVILLSFDKGSGWRVAANSKTERPKAIEVVRFGAIKLLRLDVPETSQLGRFCNPRKLLNVL